MKANERRTQHHLTSRTGELGTGNSGIGDRRKRETRGPMRGFICKQRTACHFTCEWRGAGKRDGFGFESTGELRGFLSAPLRPVGVVEFSDLRVWIFSACHVTTGFSQSVSRHSSVRHITGLTVHVRHCWLDFSFPSPERKWISDASRLSSLLSSLVSSLLFSPLLSSSLLFSPLLSSSLLFSPLLLFSISFSFSVLFVSSLLSLRFVCPPVVYVFFFE